MAPWHDVYNLTRPLFSEKKIMKWMIKMLIIMMMKTFFSWDGRCLEYRYLHLCAKLKRTFFTWVGSPVEKWREWEELAGSKLSIFLLYSKKSFVAFLIASKLLTSPHTCVIRYILIFRKNEEYSLVQFVCNMNTFQEENNKWMNE